MVSEKCNTCIFRAYDATLGGRLCYYIVRTGIPRGCPSGDECDKYISENDREATGVRLIDGKRYFNSKI